MCVSPLQRDQTTSQCSPPPPERATSTCRSPLPERGQHLVCSPPPLKKEHTTSKCPPPFQRKSKSYVPTLSPKSTQHRHVRPLSKERAGNIQVSAPRRERERERATWMCPPPLQRASKIGVCVVPPLSFYRLVRVCSACERVANVFRGGVGVVVHRRIAEGCSELLPSGPSVLVEHFYTLGHLPERYQEPGRGERERDGQVNALVSSYIQFDAYDRKGRHGRIHC